MLEKIEIAYLFGQDIVCKFNGVNSKWYLSTADDKYIFSIGKNVCENIGDNPYMEDVHLEIFGGQNKRHLKNSEDGHGQE